MPLTQRGTQHGNEVAQPVLVGHDHIGVALHHDRAARFCDGVASDIQTVQVIALGEETVLW